MNTEVGFIGLGVIGTPMAERMLEMGLPLVLWNRTPGRAEALAGRGAGLAAAPRDLAQRCGIVVTMLTDGAAVEDVARRSDGLLAGLAAGMVHCDMSTIDPASARRLAEVYAARGAHFVHAPVLGSKRPAAVGKLLIFAGGAPAALELCSPVFAALGMRTWNWDRPEQATCVKLACNLLLGGMMELFAESLVFAGKAGVDPRTMLEIYGASALAAPMYQAKGKTILERNFTPNFFLRNMRKDLDLVLAAASETGAALPVGTAVRGAFAAAAAAPGMAERDYSAIIEWLERQSAARAAAI